VSFLGIVRGALDAPAPVAPVATREEGRSPGAFLAGCLLVGVLAAGVRLARLGEWSLETDEAFTIHDAIHALGRDDGARLRFPVGYAFERLVLGAKGPVTEFEARIGPALVGALTVPLAALAFSPVVGSGAALLGAAGLAIAPWHVYWSQFARYYALLVLLVVAALGFLFLGLDRARLRFFLPGGTLLAVAVATHPSAGLLGVSLIPAPLFFAGLSGFRGKVRFTRVRTGALVATGLVLGVLLVPLLRDTFLSYRSNPTKSPSPALFLATVAFWARPALLAAAAFAALEGIRVRHRGALFLTLASFGPIGGGLLASFFARANAQYIVYTLPALITLVAWGALEVARAGRRLLAAGILAAVAADLLGETVLYFGPHAGHRASWREACAAVREGARDGDAIASTQAPIVEFYLNPGSSRLREPTRAFWLSAYTLEEFERGAPERGRLWYIVNDADLDDWPGPLRTRFRARLRERARLVAEWPRRIVTDDLGVKVYLEEP
jgi:hypothetical protein